MATTGLRPRPPPNSSVDIDAAIDLDRDKRVIELVAKLKVAVVYAFTVLRPDGAAETDITVQQDTVNNTTEHDFLAPSGANEPGNNLGFPDPDPNNPYYYLLDANIDESFNNNTGVIQGNQDVGNMVNQANVAAVAVTTSPTAFSDANAAASQINLGNTVNTSTYIDLDLIPVVVPTKEANIRDSINDNSGIIHINQNSGNMNNQLNATSLAIAVDSIVALSETDLGQFNTGNEVTELNTVKRDLISNSCERQLGRNQRQPDDW